MHYDRSRRRFLRQLGLSAAVAPFVMNSTALGFASAPQHRKRLVIMFSPNGVIPDTFWPGKTGGDFELPESLKPLAPFKDQTLVLHGVHDRIRGDGDDHMRGIGCLLTGTELFPGNIQGGGHTPAGWASGLSIDQEIKNYLQNSSETRTRFGSLEFGVLVPNHADTWTRMVYAGPNKPVAPISDPYQMFGKLYGQIKDRENMTSVLDQIRDDLKKVRELVSQEDRELLDEQTTFVRELEKQLQADRSSQVVHEMPPLDPNVELDTRNMPQLSKMQIDLMVNSFANDYARVATLQYTNSVGGARMKWLDIEEGHHELSHEPDSNEAAKEKLTKINHWYGEQMAYMAQRLAETPEPGGDGTLLDHTVILWTNELGKGNSHTQDNIPFVLVGGGLDFRMGRSLRLRGVPHNRLLMALAHGFGHHIDKFGNGNYCGRGPLNLG